MKYNFVRKLTVTAAVIAAAFLVACGTSSNENINENSNKASVNMATFKVAKPPVTKIKSSPVVFENRDSHLKLAGTVYSPRNMKPTDKLPAVLVMGPMGATKEQTQSLYAQFLVAQGYIALVFDYSYIGSSEGMPRGYEDPNTKASDILSAADFFSKHPNVDANRMAAVGICGSGVYLPYAMLQESKIKVFASVNPFTIIDTVPYDADQAEKDKKDFEAGGDAKYIPDMIEPGSEGAEYYFNADRGAVTNRVPFVTWSVPTWAAFHPTELAKGLTKPYLVVVGENAFTRQGAEGMFQNVGSKDKKLVVIPRARHFDMYDGEEFALPSIDAIIDFFKTRL